MKLCIYLFYPFIYDLRINCLQSNNYSDFEIFCQKKFCRHKLRKSTTGFIQISKELIEYVQINRFTCYNDIKEVILQGRDSSNGTQKGNLTT